MSTKYPEIFGELSREFGVNDVKTRTFDKIRYITARTAANRLDEVLGPENWEGEPLPYNEHSVKYRLTIILPDGKRVTKYALGARSSMTMKGGKGDAGDDDKGGDSDGLKRAAALFGVGRYLYKDGSVDYGREHDGTTGPEDLSHATKAQKLVAWAERQGHTQRLQALARANDGVDACEVSDERADALYAILKAATANTRDAVPAQSAPARGSAPVPPPGKTSNGNPIMFGWPRSGSALFAWCKNLEQSFRVNLVKEIDVQFCTAPLSYPRLWKEWTNDQVEQAALAVARKVAKLPGYDGQFDGKIPDLQGIKDRLWTATAALLSQLGEKDPTSENILASITSHSERFSDQFGGEVLNNLDLADNEPFLATVLKSVEADLEESSMPF